MRLYFFVLIFIITTGSVFAQNKRNRKITREYYDNGMPKKTTVVKTFERAVFEPGNYYKRTKIWVTEYYETGKIKSEEYKKTWLGTSGNGCYEMVHKTKQYNEAGKIVFDEVTECDRGKITNRYYNNAGKVTFIRINYFLLEG